MSMARRPSWQSAVGLVNENEEDVGSSSVAPMFMLIDFAVFCSSCCRATAGSFSQVVAVLCCRVGVEMLFNYNSILTLNYINYYYTVRCFVFSTTLSTLGASSVGPLSPFE